MKHGQDQSGAQVLQNKWVFFEEEIRCGTEAMSLEPAKDAHSCSSICELAR